MGDKDITEKTPEALNDVFADIVNGLLFKGRQVVQENALTDAQPFSMYKADGDIHEQERDVAKYWNEASEGVCVRIALLGMENQSRYEKRMPLKGHWLRRDSLSRSAFGGTLLSGHNAGSLFRECPLG